MSEVYWPSAPGAPDQRKPLRFGANDEQATVQLGVTALDYDGDRVFLVLPEQDQPLLAIAPSGAITGAIPLAAPEGTTSLVKVRVHGKRAAVVFQGPLPLGTAVIQIYDLRTGKAVSSLFSEGSNIVSYDGNVGFTYLGSGPHTRFVWHASPSATQ